MPPADAKDAARELDAQSDRFARLLAAATRAQLAAPVHTVGGFIDLIVEDAERNGYARYGDDIAKIRGAWQRLAGMVDRLVDSDAAGSGEAERGVGSGKLRHDLRTPIAAILGYAELLGEDAADAGHTAFVETLQALVAASRRLLDQVDTLVATLRDQDKATAPDSLALQQHHYALSAIRAVLVQPADPPPAIRGRVLIIDDDPTNVDLLSRRLERDGHAIERAGSGEAALAWLEHEAVDIILLDLIMPGLTGIEVLRLLRQRDDTKLVPVIIISGLDEADGAIRCIEAGADDYLSKPVDAVLLRARINAALERKFLRDRELAITRRLEVERERSESLLRNVLPESVVERLRGGETVIADHFNVATILFCDIVDFTALSARLSPGATLDLLNAIFSEFDKIAAAAGVEKIKTIGDAYMAAGGVPKVNEGHAAAVATMALRLPAVAEAIGQRFGLPLAVRIGMDTGPVVAGIIGTDKFVYDVWGDTVNTASRMEHHGVAGRVHITAAVRGALGAAHTYDVVPPMHVKGKGVMQTFLIRPD